MSLIPELSDSCTLTAVKPVTITGFTILMQERQRERERERGNGREQRKRDREQ